MSSAAPDFTTTHWSVVLASAQGDSPQAAAALEELCRAYWYPLYAFVRRQGHSPHDAEDLLQAFFVRFLEKHYVNDADRSKGRFRSFLLAALMGVPPSLAKSSITKSIRPWRDWRTFGSGDAGVLKINLSPVFKKL